MAFKFEQLEIWHLAIEMADSVDKLRKGFPNSELYILTSQMKRAADSISLNIAEGSTGQSDAEQSRFLSYAQRSALEVVNCCHLGKRRGYIDENTLKALYNDLEKLITKIQAFKNYLTRTK